METLIQKSLLQEELREWKMRCQLLIDTFNKGHIYLRFSSQECVFCGKTVECDSMCFMSLKRSYSDLLKMEGLR